MDDTFPTRRAASGRRRGFTLVEMLVVIAIIAVLAGLITMAAGPTIAHVKRTTIKSDITQLEMALNAYKEKYGDYPPDFADVTTDSGKVLVLRHLRKAFPRYILSGDTLQQWSQFHNDVSVSSGDTLNVDMLTPANAIVFWLGGLPDASRDLAGFSADPAYPFRADGSRTDPLFEFDQTRLFRDGNGWPAYKSDHVKGDVPYVYFRARLCGTHGKFNYGLGNHAGVLSWDAGNAGVCVPYRIQEEHNWNKPKSFQIISPGMDGRFGALANDADFVKVRLSPTGEGFTDGDYDNITNFSSTTLEDGLE